MCKIFLVAGVRPEHQAEAQKLVMEASKIISAYDSDGVGYAAITKSGKIYGEKWLNKDDAFLIHEQPQASPNQKYIMDVLGKAAKFKLDMPTEQVYESFGDDSDKIDTVSYILHARKKTTGQKTIPNTHPFFEPASDEGPSTALIHNGSIFNHDKLTKKTSTCDSEVILHEYLKNHTYHNPYGIMEVAKALVGEYTVGVLSSQEFTDGTVTPILDIFKSNKDLHAAYIPEIGAIAFSTWENHLESAAKAAGMTVQYMAEIKDGYLLRLNAVTGERIDDVVEFTLSPRTLYSSNTITHPYRQAMMTVLPKEDTVNDLKRQFESIHPTIFEQDYYSVGKNFSHLENSLMSELDDNTSVDYQSLKLTNKILNIAH